MYASDGGATSRFIGLALSPRPTIAGFLLEPALGTGQFKVSICQQSPQFVARFNQRATIKAGRRKVKM